MSFAYYNEFDPIAAEWLRWLIDEGHIANGWVDERSICDVEPGDLDGYSQHHFFAGIGGWPLAARMAGWPDDCALWTGSCPCQPFSQAGQGKGIDDVRHLWPDLFRLARARRPAVLMGEQVAGKAGYGWFDGVAADLASENYASRYVDIPSCAVDAPHIRSRGYWIAVADANGSGRDRREEAPQREPIKRVAAERTNGDMGYSHSTGLPKRQINHVGGGVVRQEGSAFTQADARQHGDLSDSDCGGGQIPTARQQPAEQGLVSDVDPYGRNGTFWSDSEWLTCHDGKARRTKSGLPLLAHGISGRVAAWRGFGNAINPVLAAEVIRAFMETEDIN